MSRFGYYILWMYLWVDDMATWGVCYISAVMFYCWNFYACQLRIIWRPDVYFLNIYYIRVIYRFNRSWALHLEFNFDPSSLMWSSLVMLVIISMSKNWQAQHAVVINVTGTKQNEGLVNVIVQIFTICHSTCKFCACLPSPPPLLVLCRWVDITNFAMKPCKSDVRQIY